ncbi:MAG: FAD-dependent oxidoreductase [Acidimicrobiia bacterium]|nr:FAD-dependent oxidoreductase [Acidimicrobiia bacterium]
MDHNQQPRFLVIGGGPAGHAAATTAATYGAEVTLVEDQIIGGAAHLHDCVPSKAMVASAARLANLRAAGSVGIDGEGSGAVDILELDRHVARVTQRLASGFTDMIESQGVDIIRGRGRFVGPNKAEAETQDGVIPLEFDKALVSTGSRPWVPDWAELDYDRLITTREAYSLPALPDHMIVVGSGVTGVEMVHIFSSLGSKVTLLVSRHHVLPHRDTEVAMVLEEDFINRGVTLMKGSRANGARRDGDGVVVTTEDGREVRGSHCLLAVGSVPNTQGIGLEDIGVDMNRGYVEIDEFQRTSVPHIYAGGDIAGKMPLSSVASQQGRIIAKHIMGRTVEPLDYGKVAQAIFTRPEIASVGLEEVDAAAEGRKVRITKVPMAANPKALIVGDSRGFVKVISDPATRIVLGGTVVGRHAAELVAPLALAVTARLKVDVLFDSMMVHPSLSESVSEAAE